MNPFFFGDSAAPLFGAYHAPADGVGSEGVLICPPVGHEQLRAHRSLRLLADTLAGDGRHVLRFDYPGTGDSAGGPERLRVRAWQDSITLAHDELRDISGATRITVVGLRLGATLAAHALRDSSDVRAFVAWDPVTDGNHFMDEVESLHDARVKQFEAGRGRRVPAGSADTIMGFAFPSALRDDLRRMRLPVPSEDAGALQVWPRLGIAASEDRAEYRALADACRARGAQVLHHVAPDSCNWGDFRHVGGVMTATRVQRAVAALVRGETP